MVDKIEIVPQPGMTYEAARVEVLPSDGRALCADVPASLGSPGNPLGWQDLEDKFMSLTEPVIGGRACTLFNALKSFDTPGRYADVEDLLSQLTPQSGSDHAMSNRSSM